VPVNIIGDLWIGVSGDSALRGVEDPEEGRPGNPQFRRTAPGHLHGRRR
jgi:hypothetical protein